MNPLSRLWQQFAQAMKARPMARREIARLEGLGEAAYDKMYDVRQYYEARELYDDAYQRLEEAKTIAKAWRMRNEVKRLSARQGHFYRVYVQLFRP